MDTIEKSEEINQHRRSFLGTSVATVAAAQLLLNDSVEAQPSKTRLAGMRAIKPGTNTSFASLKQIDAGLLSVGYAEAGPCGHSPSRLALRHSQLCDFNRRLVERSSWILGLSRPLNQGDGAASAGSLNSMMSGHG